MKYLPEDVVMSELKQDKVKIDVPHPKGDGQRTYKVSRWAYIPVDQNRRPNSRDTQAQHHENHGYATVTSEFNLSVVPNDDYPGTRIIGLKILGGGVETAIQTLMYYYRWGSQRCNINLDSELRTGVYCYPDVRTVVRKLQLINIVDQRSIIAVLSGWLLKTHKQKERMSFKSRSCRLLGFFAPIDVNVRLPMVMGLEDKMIFRLAPEDLGAPSTWIYRIFNMTWRQVPQIQNLNRVSD